MIRRRSPDLAAKLGGYRRGQRVRGRRSADAPSSWSNPGRAIAGPGTITLYEVGTVKDVAISGVGQAPPLRQRRRRHE